MKMFKTRSRGKKEGKTMLDGVKIKINCEGLDEAIKKVNQLIALLKEVQQIADSLEVGLKVDVDKAK